MTQEMTLTSPEFVAYAVARLQRDDQYLVKGFILALIEKSEQSCGGERREGA